MAVLKFIFTLIYKTIVGGVIIFLINLVGNFFNFHIALNLVSSLLVGLLGFPGVILVSALKIIF